MRLSGQQFETVSQALLDAFNPGSLEAMVRIQLNERLEQIAGGGNQTEVAHSLIQWAEGKDRIQELIDGAYTANPGNGMLHALKTRAQTENWFGVKSVGEDAALSDGRSRVVQIKRKALEERLALLTLQYEAVRTQRNLALSPAAVIKLQHQLADLTQQMQVVVTELDRLQ